MGEKALLNFDLLNDKLILDDLARNLIFHIGVALQYTFPEKLAIFATILKFSQVWVTILLKLFQFDGVLLFHRINPSLSKRVQYLLRLP